MDPIDRRQFGWYAAAAGLGVIPAIASEPPTGTNANESRPDETPKPAVDSDMPPPPTPEILLLSLLASRIPAEHLTDEVLQGIARDLRGDRLRSAVLSSFPLEQSDQPAFAFVPYRGPDL